jgi:hypothetical protein
MSGHHPQIVFNSPDAAFDEMFVVFMQALRVATSCVRAGGVVLVPNVVEVFAHRLHSMYQLIHARFSQEMREGVLVDVSGSGYLAGYNFARIRSDFEIANKIANVQSEPPLLRRVFLDTLFKTGELNRHVLDELAQAQYFSDLANSRAEDFDLFVVSDVIEVREGILGVSWMQFDAIHNTPAVYSMTFSVQGSSVDIGELRNILRFESTIGASVSVLAARIDAALVTIAPISLVRATLGPLYHQASRQDSFWRKVLERHGVASSYVLSVIVDSTHATSAVRASALAESFGVVPQVYQTYAVDMRTPLHSERGAYNVEEYKILPHTMLQSVMADDTYADQIEKRIRFHAVNPKGVLL